MDDLDAKSVHELLTLHSGALQALQRKGVLRTENNPTGDFAEWLAARAFRLTLERNAATGFDGQDAKGVRYQIKGRRITARNPSMQLSAIRNLEKKQFDVLLAVIFGEDWHVQRAATIPHHCIAQLGPRLRRFSKHVNGHVLYIREELFRIDGVSDVTSNLRDADPELGT